MRAETAINWMNRFNEKVQEKQVYLSELDTPIGDGDHGGNMARGMDAVVNELKDKEFSSAGDVLKVVSMQLLSKVGGSSVPLYGSAFMGISKAEREGGTVADAVKAGLEMIQKRGKAEVGEKTMVDVWTPVLNDAEKGQLTIEKIQSYVQATAPLKATKGRASYVGERSIDHIDPGSYSSGLLFEAYLEVEE